MNMAWDYAVLSHTAKECGGPEALMKIIEGRGFQEGFWVGAEAGANPDDSYNTSCTGRLRSNHCCCTKPSKDCIILRNQV